MSDPIYVFCRKEGFYPVEGIKSDAEVLDHVRLNPGTLRVVRLPEDRIVWEEGDPLNAA
jgi:hypothetical protein